MMVAMSLFISGSSPHTWGTHDCQVAKELYDRFIPTHVGNTIPESMVLLG